MPNPTTTIYMPWHALDDVHRMGTRALQPVATAVTPGTLYCVTDEDNAVERSNGTVWQVYGGGGAGDVEGPAGATANDLVSFDGPTGKLLKDSGILASTVARTNLTNTFTGAQYSLGPIVIGGTPTVAPHVNNPSLYLYDAAEPANSRMWRIMNQSQLLRFYTQDDGESGHIARMVLDRGGNLMVTSRVQIGGTTAAYAAFRQGTIANPPGLPIVEVVAGDASVWAGVRAANFISTTNYNNLADLTCGPTNFTAGINVTAGSYTGVGNFNTAGHVQIGGPVYPGRYDTGWTEQGGWWLASHASYGLYSNTGFYAANFQAPRFYGALDPGYLDRSIAWTEVAHNPADFSWSVGAQYNYSYAIFNNTMTISLMTSGTNGANTWELYFRIPAGRTAKHYASSPIVLVIGGAYTPNSGCRFETSPGDVWIRIKPNATALIDAGAIMIYGQITIPLT